MEAIALFFPSQTFSDYRLSAPVKNGAIMAGSGRSQWSTRESPRSTETQ